MTDEKRLLTITHGEPLYEGTHFDVYEATFPASSEFGENVILDGYCVWNKRCQKSDGEYRGELEARATADHWNRTMQDMDTEQLTQRSH